MLADFRAHFQLKAFEILGRGRHWLGSMKRKRASLGHQLNARRLQKKQKCRLQRGSKVRVISRHVGQCDLRKGSRKQWSDSPEIAARPRHWKGIPRERRCQLHHQQPESRSEWRHPRPARCHRSNQPALRRRRSAPRRSDLHTLSVAGRTVPIAPLNVGKTAKICRQRTPRKFLVSADDLL